MVDRLSRSPQPRIAPADLEPTAQASAPVTPRLDARETPERGAAAGRTARTSRTRVPPGTPARPAALSALTAAQAGAELGKTPRLGAKLVTASDVERLITSGDFSSLTPALPRPLWPFVQALGQALQIDGPLGDRGPLSPRGALGSEVWNPAFWMKAMGDWSGLSKDLSAAGGPGSGLGSLGDLGPTNPAWIRAGLMALGPAAQQLDAGGLFTALGPMGALSALGALGYLGVVGGHGFAQDASGQFVGPDGAVQRTTDVTYQGAKRSMELVEMYPERFASKLANNDASWMVRGALPPSDPEDTFRFTPKKDQLVTLTAVPDDRGDVFSIELLDKGGRVLARSDSERYVNFIQVEAKAGVELQVRITRQDGQARGPSPVSAFIDAMLFPLTMMGGGKRPAEHGYRLLSTGSTEELGKMVTGGAHQRVVDLG
jgi:hypothetical protein